MESNTGAQKRARSSSPPFRESNPKICKHSFSNSNMDEFVNDEPPIIDLTTEVELVDLTNPIDSPIVCLGQRRPTSPQQLNLSIEFPNQSSYEDNEYDQDDRELDDVSLVVSSSISLIEESESSNESSKVVIYCPVCLDNIEEIQNCNQQLMSTTCGHIFCSSCITQFLNNRKSFVCPTCRKRITIRQIHPIYLC